MSAIVVTAAQHGLAQHPASRLLALGSRQSGKTTGAGKLSVKLAHAGQRVLYYAPRVGQTQTYREACLTTAIRAGLPHRLHAQERTLHVGAGRIQSFTLKNPEDQRGIGGDFVIVDEAAYVKEKAVDSIVEPLTWIKGAKIVLICTPPDPEEPKLTYDPTWVIDRLRGAPQNGWTPYALTALNSPYMPRASLTDAHQRLPADVFAREALGLVVDTVPGATIKPEWVRYVDEAPDGLEQVVVAVDPAGSPRTGTVGIIVVARQGDAAYVLADYSCRADADVWPEQIGLAAANHGADTVVAEDNFGGDMVRRLLADLGSSLVVRLVTSTSSKPLRAQRTGTMYAKGRVFHVGRPADYRQLVTQLTMWVPRPSASSPDRLDALVHGINHFFFSTGGRMSLG